MILLDNINLLDDSKIEYYKQNKRNAVVYSDIIYTFDIEVSSLFNINGKWTNFDYNIKDYEYI